MKRDTYAYFCMYKYNYYVLYLICFTGEEYSNYYTYMRINSFEVRVKVKLIKTVIMIQSRKNEV